MTTAAWPGTLPQEVMTSGYSLALADNRLRTPVDYGPPLVRKRSSANIKPLSVTMSMTPAQWDDFLDFINNDLEGGTLPFTFPEPYGGADLLVMFGDSMPTTEPYGTLDYLVHMQLVVMP